MDYKEIQRIFYRDGYRLAHQHLGEKISPETLSSAIEQLYRSVDELLDSFLKRSAAEGKVAECKKGCAWCCHQPVFAVTHEFLYLHHYVLLNFTEQKRTRVHESASEKAMKTHNKPLKELMKVKAPCPFLESGACSIYSARPMACRIYLSSSVQACIREYHDPADEHFFPDLFEFPLKAGRMLNEGFVAYLKQVGFKIAELPMEQGYAALVSLGQTLKGWIEEQVASR